MSSTQGTLVVRFDVASDICAAHRALVYIDALRDALAGTDGHDGEVVDQLAGMAEHLDEQAGQDADTDCSVCADWQPQDDENEEN